MNAQSFIETALQNGIKIESKDGRLDIDAPKDALTPDVVSYLKANKSELIAELSRHEDAEHGECYRCQELTESMVTHCDGTGWDWCCSECFGRRGEA